MPDLPLVRLFTGNEKAKPANDVGTVLPVAYVNLAVQVTSLSSMLQSCKLDVPSTLISASADPGAIFAAILAGVRAKALKKMPAPINAYFIIYYFFPLKENIQGNTKVTFIP